MNYKILIVDDEAANLRLLERLFRADYTVITAAGGDEALEFLSQHDFALIISDQRMPGMTGVDFLKRSAAIRPHTVRIILTGYTDVQALVEALNSGVVYKYVTKPWVNGELCQTVKRAVQHYESIRKQHILGLENERLRQRLKTTVEGFVRMVGEMLVLKDPQAHGHARRTADYAVEVGKSIGLDPQELKQLLLAAFLHEVPHIRIPNKMLLKTAHLMENDSRIVKETYKRGLEILAGVPDLEEVAAVLRYQHEQFNGQGFPDGLSGHQIPILARIIAVADAYDEMTTVGISHPGCTKAEALRHLQLAAGTKFDPSIVKKFTELQIRPNE